MATRTESQHGGAEAERPAISIVLPAFNEEEGLPATLAALERALAGSDLVYEIVVVDDGSTDGTGRSAAAAPTSPSSATAATAATARR